MTMWLCYNLESSWTPCMDRGHDRARCLTIEYRDRFRLMEKCRALESARYRSRESSSQARFTPLTPSVKFKTAYKNTTAPCEWGSCACVIIKQPWWANYTTGSQNERPKSDWQIRIQCSTDHYVLQPPCVCDEPPNNPNHRKLRKSR